MLSIVDADALAKNVGQPLGTTDWMTIDQSRIGLFADATDDHQWIHVDLDRAKAGPFGGTIAHGYLILSLLGPMISSVLDLDGTAQIVNYGLGRVRFTNPVLAGSRIRGHAVLKEAKALDGAVQVTIDWTVEIDGAQRPACVAEQIFRAYR